MPTDHIVVLSSANGSTNLGDEAMWEAAALVTRQELPACRLTTDATDNWDPPLPNVDVLPFLHTELRRGKNVLSTFPSAPLVIEALLSKPRRNAFAYRKALQLLGEPENTVGPLGQSWLRALDSADALVFSGAGAMCDMYAPHGIAAWSLLARWARKRDVPVVMLGQGIGPLLEEGSINGAGQLLSCVDTLTVRDEASGELALSLGASRVIVTPDWAILNQPNSGDRDTADELVRSMVGETPFFALSFHRAGHDKRTTRNLLTALAEEVAQECRRQGLAVVFVPNMTSRSLRADDRTVIDEMISHWNPKSAAVVKVLRTRVGPRIARSILGLSKGVVTSRYHPAIFALSEGVGSVGLSYNAYYDQKLRGALSQFGPESGQMHRLGAGNVSGSDLVRHALDSSPHTLAPKDLERISGPYRDFLSRHVARTD